MAVTLVMAAHGTEAKQNGFGGCHSRWANEGLCSGVQTAAWLNGLGDDEAPFGVLKNVTNGEVRRNWLAGSGHIVAVEPELSRLRGKVEAARREYRRVKAELARAERAKATAVALIALSN